MATASHRTGLYFSGIVLAILMFGSAWLTPAAAAKSKAPKLPQDQLREVNRLLSEYRGAGKDLEKKQEICQKVLDMGPAAAELMSATVERDIRPQLRRYSAKFQQQAALLAKKKVRDIDLNEVVQLRRTVLGLQKRGDGFTKEAIQREGDPALKKLETIFVIERGAVLEPSEDLQADRKRLVSQGRLWQECQAKLPQPAVEEGEDPPKPPDFEQYLQGDERLAAAMVTPMDLKTRAILAANSRLGEKLDPEEARTVLALNLTRNLLGLSALVVDLKLTEAARDHSHDMETRKFFAHESPVEGKKTPWDRAKRFGTSASGENIVMGVHDGRAANEAWFHSPGHHKNMLGDHVRVGVGRSGVYFTELFGR